MCLLAMPAYRYECVILHDKFCLLFITPFPRLIEEEEEEEELFMTEIFPFIQPCMHADIQQWLEINQMWCWRPWLVLARVVCSSSSSKCQNIIHVCVCVCVCFCLFVCIRSVYLNLCTLVTL